MLPSQAPRYSDRVWGNVLDLCCESPALSVGKIPPVYPMEKGQLSYPNGERIIRSSWLRVEL